jgi:hypothetical protein
VVLLALALGAAAGCGDDDVAPRDDSAQCNNSCTTYPQQWKTSCPGGERCIQFLNSCAQTVSLSYQIGCDADGKPGAPTCNCTQGPMLSMGQSAYWQITDVNDSSNCVPKISRRI